MSDRKQEIRALYGHTMGRDTCNEIAELLVLLDAERVRADQAEQERDEAQREAESLLKQATAQGTWMQTAVEATADSTADRNAAEARVAVLEAALRRVASSTTDPYLLQITESALGVEKEPA